jgi:hypothetical protein
MRFLTEEEKNAEGYNKDGRGRPAKYPWESWLQHEETARLVQGEDFEGDPQTFRVTARSAAARMGGTIKTKVIRDGERLAMDVTFTLNDPTGPEQPWKPLSEPLGPPATKELDWQA